MGYYTFMCVCACVCMGVRLMSVGSSRSPRSLSLLLLLHASTFCVVTFHTQFRFLFNSPLPQPSATACTCIFVCYFVAPLLLLPDLRESFNEREREREQLHYSILYYVLSFARYVLSHFALSCTLFFFLHCVLPPTRACLARVSAVSFLWNNFNHVSYAAASSKMGRRQQHGNTRRVLVPESRRRAEQNRVSAHLSP